MEFEILGPLRVTSGGAAVDLGGRLQRGLLAELLLTPNAPVSDDQLIDELWGEQPPPSARHLLEVYVSRLRAVLGAADGGERRIARGAGGYAIRVSDHELDADRFLAASAQGQQLADAEPATAELSLASALQLWRGAPFADLSDPPPAIRVQAEYLERQRRATTQAWVSVGLRLGRHRQLVPELAQLAAGQPYDESLCASLMLALYRSGRQADALEAGRALRARLREDLGVDPGADLASLYRQILLQDPALAVEPPEPPSSLPAPLSTFVGRVEELETVAGLLEESRLVTLTGPAGAGKTRLAIEAAQRARRRFAGGVVWLDLSTITGADGLEPAFASALGITSTGGDLRRAITGAVAGREALLVLDNCEAVAAAVRDLAADILRAGSGVRILATSRIPLRVEGECRWPVPMLSLPAADSGPAAAEASDAVRLFLERGRSVNTSLRLTAENGRDIVEACRCLDGLPLAIEMAAARLHVLTPREIVHALGTRFELLTTPGERPSARHGALHATLEVGYAALPPHERAAFDRLAVFRGPFDLAAAAAVACPERAEAADLLRGLVDASMVVTEQAGGLTRYRLLETLRAFAARRLGDGADREAASAAHARHYLGAAEAASADLDTPAFAGRVASLSRDRLELAAALEWSLAHETRATTLAAAPALREYWFRVGEAAQAGIWANRMLSGDVRGVPPALLSEAHNAAAFAANLALDLPTSAVHLEAAENLARAGGDAIALVYALWGATNLAFASGDLPALRQRAVTALEAADAVPSNARRWARARPLSALGYAAVFSGSPAEARPLFAESAVLFRELGDRASLVVLALVPLVKAALLDGDVSDAERIAAEAIEAGTGTAWEAAALTGYAMALNAAGDPTGAEPAARRALHMALEAGLDHWVGMSLHELARCAVATGRIERAARLAGAYRRHAVTASVDPAEVAAVEAACRANLGVAHFERLAGEGASLDSGATAALGAAE